MYAISNKILVSQWISHKKSIKVCIVNLLYSGYVKFKQFLGALLMNGLMLLIHIYTTVFVLEGGFVKKSFYQTNRDSMNIY